MLPLLVALYGPVRLLMDHLQPEARFERLTGTPLPPHARRDYLRIDGAFIGDIRDIWIIQAPADEMNAMISGLNLMSADRGGRLILATPDPHITARIPDWWSFKEWTRDPAAPHLGYLSVYLNPDHTCAYIHYGTY
ncbi:MAG: hypothetical protein QM755_03245 [Luteolibacter sp.]